jgi:hypothetical protein
MSHLSREELVDSLDGPLPPARQAHAETCPRCRQERAALRAILQDVSQVPVSEPSPLFWDHLSARVRDHLAQEPPPAAPGWGSWLTAHRALSAAVTIALCIIVSWAGWRELRTLRAPAFVSAPTSGPTMGSSSATGGAGGIGGDEAAGDAPDDVEAIDAIRPDARRASLRPRLTPAAATDAADWNLMVGLVDDVAWDDDGAAGGMGSLRPGSADAVVRELSVDEREELARLIHEEMVRPPSS